MSDWEELVNRIKRPNNRVKIAICGKYVYLKDAYKSIYESIDHAGMHHQSQIRIGRIQSSDIEREGAERLLAGRDDRLGTLLRRLAPATPTIAAFP